MSTEARLEQVDKEIEALLANKKALEAEIEAEKKPKIETFDLYTDGTSNNIIVGNDESGFKMAYQDGSESVGTVNTSEIIKDIGYEKIGNLREVFDDLKAMQEDVEEFEMCEEGHVYIKAKASPDNKEVDFEFDLDYLELEDLSTFILKLRQMEATLKRRQK